MRLFAGLFIGLISALLLGVPAHADPARYLAEARDRNLAQSPLWLNLLQYDTSRRNPRSDVRPGDFFLSDTGNTDPAAELQAFIAAAFAPVPDNPNDHAICRFPARLRFLRLQFGDLPTPSPDCTDFAAWTGGGPITDATLIYASGSLGEPATFYGHILLKFSSNTSFSDTVIERPVGGTLLDTSLNYGAIVPDGEPGIVYILKGLFGGYASRYTNVEYYEQRGNYVQSQDRDLWEYRLALTDDQLQLLVESSWELYQQENTYYFLTKNCAYRFAELIALVTGQEIALAGKPWSMPIDVFVDLVAMEHPDGTPVVTDIERVRAPSTQFLAAYRALKPDQQAALETYVRAILNDNAQARPPAYFRRTDISDTDRAKVIEAGLLYVAMVRARTEGSAEDDIAKLNRAFLVQRLALPPGSTQLGSRTVEQPPHQAHRSATAQVTPLSNSRLGGGVELRLRPVFTDFLTLTAPDHPFSEMAMGDISLIARDGQVNLQRLDLLRITALSTRTTRLPYDYKPSWRLRLGAESENLAQDGDIVALGEYGYGHAFAPTDHSVIYALGEGRIDSGPRAAQLALRVGAVARLGAGFQISLSSALSAPVADRDQTRTQSQLTMRFGSSPLYDVRLTARREDDSDTGRTTEIGLSLSRHF